MRTSPSLDTSGQNAHTTLNVGAKNGPEPVLAVAVASNIVAVIGAAWSIKYNPLVKMLIVVGINLSFDL
jgi:uncharacterized membrane protein YjjB (DUF3815 family)